MYINNLNTVLSDQQQKKKRLFARSASGMFSKSGSPLAFFHKFGSWGGGGGAFAPIAFPASTPAVTLAKYKTFK